MTVRTRTFKSGNSVALRLPKALGVKEGTEMTVREERGRYIVEPAEPKEPEQRKRIDLAGIWGSHAGHEPADGDAEEYEDIPREWHLLGLDPR